MCQLGSTKTWNGMEWNGMNGTNENTVFLSLRRR